MTFVGSDLVSREVFKVWFLMGLFYKKAYGCFNLGLWESDRCPLLALAMLMGEPTVVTGGILKRGNG